MMSLLRPVLAFVCCAAVFQVAVFQVAVAEGPAGDGQSGSVFNLHPADSPVDNPLKGLVPYARPRPDRFPHSMEFMYLALSDLMKAEDQFDWQPLEQLLDDIASRGNQAVIRVYVEYPGKTKGIPEYLIEQGLKVHTYVNTNTAPLPPTKVSTPDYEDPRLRSALTAFITALGDKYDGDPRLAYITAGLLGTWGEWHTYPRDDLWASKTTQDLVLDAYQRSFASTPVLLRYPAGPGHYSQTANATRSFGYHDDSFAWATLDTGKKQDNWFYMPALKAAGNDALAKWKTHPIGGEIRPEVWGKIFDQQDQWPKQAQDFHDCVTATHATWLMDTGMFREVASQQRRDQATREVRRMGYDLYVRRAEFVQDPSSRDMQVRLDVINRGVAPFYADWPTEIALVSADGKIAQRFTMPGLSMRHRLPSSDPHALAERFNTAGLTGKYTVLLRVVNPLAGGKALRFANQEQDKTKAGWLTLGNLQLEAE